MNGDNPLSKQQRKTTKGWKFLLTFKDGSTNWFRLADLMREYPIEIANYVKNNNLQDEDAFSWWVHKSLVHHQRMVSKVKSEYWKKTHMFGIELPKTYTDCERLDHETENDLRKKAIEKEMIACKVAFKVLEDTEKLPVGFKEISCPFLKALKEKGCSRKYKPTKPQLCEEIKWKQTLIPTVWREGALQCCPTRQHFLCQKS